MQVVRIGGLDRHAGETVEVRGWLQNRRSSGKVRFLQVRDGTGIVQAVMGAGDVPPEVFALGEDLPYESSLAIVGEVRRDRRAPGGHEILLRDARVFQRAEAYPITKQAHGTDFLLRHRHLWLRSRRQHATLRVRHEVIRAIRRFLDERGFVCIDAPIFTPAACEGTTTLFEVEYFDQAAYLTQSGQLYNEAAAMAFGRVYCFGPTFRAERSKTRRHLTEFWMVEPEMAFADLKDVMDLAEALVAEIVRAALERCAPELATLGRDTAPLARVAPPFPRIAYREAAEILRRKGIDLPDGVDLGAPHETALSEAFDRPVMIHRYPAAVKAFYMKRDPEDPGKALCVDVLAPEGVGEIVGGGQREDDLAVLEHRIEEHGLPREAFAWYLDLRRYGSVPHGGFGLGLERTVAWICGTHHVRETIPFPRMLYRIYP